MENENNVYSVPYFWGTLGIVYNDKYVKPGEISTWNDLWRKKYRGQILLVDSARDIDLILGGHSHTYFKQLEYLNNLDGKPVPVDQNGKSAIWVGKMVLDLSKK